MTTFHNLLQITKASREDGEKYYLRTVYPEYQLKNDPDSRKAFIEENPCFSMLIEKYGEPVIAKELSKQDKIKQNFASNASKESLSVHISKF